MKVGLMILGAQKSGTTSLFNALVSHERIAGCRTKESHFFSTSRDWRAELPRYEAMFDGLAGDIFCEASTTYTFYPHRNLRIWEDMFEYNPELRFIYIVRNPVDRIVSAYRHNVSRGRKVGTFADFALNNPLPIDVSRYYTQILPFVRTFGRERVLLLDFDDLKSDQRGLMHEVAEFIGLDRAAFDAFPAIWSNRAEHSKPHHALDRLAPIGRLFRRTAPEPEVPENVRQAILDLLELEIDAISEMMGRDFATWR